MAILLVHLEFREHRVFLRHLPAGCERLAQRERRIKGHLSNNSRDHAAAEVDHLNFEMFDGEYPMVPLTFRPLETYIAEHEVGLTLQPVLFGLQDSFVSGVGGVDVLDAL